MKQMGLMTVAVAASTFACTALLSFGRSEQGGVTLSVESAQARVGRPLTPMSGAGVARRHARRAGYGYGAGAIGAGAAAVVQLPRLRPPHPTWDGEAAPTTQAQVTTVVVDTTGAELSGLGRPTMAVTHPQRGAV